MIKLHAHREGTKSGNCIAPVPIRQVSGCNDDILDILVIPQPEGSLPLTETTSDRIADNNSISQSIVEGNRQNATEKKFLLAIITNSSQIRLVDESFSCTPLDGHTDIVLAADVSPDGCVRTRYSAPLSLTV